MCLCTCVFPFPGVKCSKPQEQQQQEQQCSGEGLYLKNNQSLFHLLKKQHMSGSNTKMFPASYDSAGQMRFFLLVIFVTLFLVWIYIALSNKCMAFKET